MNKRSYFTVTFSGLGQLRTMIQAVTPEKSYYCRQGKVTWHFEQVSRITKPDIWLQLKTADLLEARTYLERFGVIVDDRMTNGMFPLVTHLSDPSGNMLFLCE